MADEAKAIEALIEYEKKLLNKCEEELDEMNLDLAKIRLRARIFGNADLEFHDREKLTSLPTKIAEKREEINHHRERLERLEHFADQQASS